MKKQSFIYSAVILSFSNALLQVLGFVYRIALSRLVGAEGLGVYRLVFLGYTVINSVCLSGVCLATARISAKNQALGKFSMFRAVTSASIRIFIVIFMFFGTSVILFSDFISVNILGDSRTATALVVMLFCIFLTGFENILKSLFLGTGKINSMMISEVSEQIIRIISVLGLIMYFGSDNLEITAALIMLGMGISEIFSVTYLYFAYKRNFGLVAKPKKDKHLKFEILKIALPISLSAMLTNIISSASSVILPMCLVAFGMSHKEALAELGIISSMAFPLLLLPIALISSLASLIMPKISKLNALGDKKGIINTINKSLKTTGFIGIPATCAIAALSIPLCRLFFNVDLNLNYLLMLGVSAVLIYYQSILGSILNGLDKEKAMVANAILAEIIQLSLTFILVRKFGVNGYIIAMIISEMFCIILHMLCIKKTLNMSIKLRLFLEPILCGALVYFWVKVIYYNILVVVSAQSTAVLISFIAGIIIYYILLRIFGINIKNNNTPISGKMQKIKAFTFI